MNKKILEVSNISVEKKQSKSYILRNVSFCLQKWEVLSIIWQNGAWKSTLLKTIAWLQDVSRWSIRTYTKNISYIPQNIHLDIHFPMTVQEFLYIFNEKSREKDIHSLMKVFDVENMLRASIHTLSGWEFQKILMVNALLSEPKLLLLDESTSNMDAVWEEGFYKMIFQLKKEFPELSVIIVSHNLYLVYKYSQKILCLHDKWVCCQGTPFEIHDNKEVNKIFGEYMLPYKHHLHTS